MIVLLATSLPVLAQTNAESSDALPASPGSLVSAPTTSPSSPDGWLSPGTDPQNRLGKPFLQHLVEDQKQFWTAPFDLDNNSKKTLIPFVGFTGVLFASDDWLSKQVPNKPDQLNRSSNISNYAVYSLIGAGGGAYLWGHLTNNDHLKETGLLSGEAVLNSAAVSYVFKGITQRPRPSDNQGSGFFQGGMSFPSEHSAAAWSIASVVAHEYPGPLTQFLAYGLASTVTLTRVTSQNHFPSDAFIGSVLGWYFGRQIYRAHHDSTLPGGAWGNLLEDKHTDGSRNPKRMASSYVPLDSWIYPSLERLAAMGYIRRAYLGLRPWSRMECARMLEEAEEAGLGHAEGTEAQGIYRSLADEFVVERSRLDGAANLGLNIDSVYTRVTTISGSPLRDGAHFGQTINNDYGRQYWEGTSFISGLSTHAEAGPFAFYVRGEYQSAPAIPSYPLPVLQAIADKDRTIPSPNGIDQVSQFELLDSYGALKLGNVQFSFGKQTAWFGPGESGPWLFSDNAPPLMMLRINSDEPFRIPLLSKILGPAQAEFFIGQLSGQQFVFDNNTVLGPNVDPEPYMHGEKISFKPTRNLEFGMGITAEFGGPGLPFTWGNFIRTYYRHASDIAEKPGKRLSAFDLTYKVPGLRNWLTFYLDSLVVDEISPIGSTRPSFTFGLHLPRVPYVPKLELRAEGLRTARTENEFAPGFVYTDRRYRSGYTSDGNLLGSWIGRAGTGGQAWLTYWLSARSSLQGGYRAQRVDMKFLEGGTTNDFSFRWNQVFSDRVGLSAFVQYENWRFPLLASDQKRNVTTAVQFTYWPQWRSK